MGDDGAESVGRNQVRKNLQANRESFNLTLWGHKFHCELSAVCKINSSSAQTFLVPGGKREEWEDRSGGHGAR